MRSVTPAKGLMVCTRPMSSLDREICPAVGIEAVRKAGIPGMPASLSAADRQIENSSGLYVKKFEELRSRPF